MSFGQADFSQSDFGRDNEWFMAAGVAPNGGRAYLFAKRVVDITIALIGLIALAPLFLLIAVIIKTWSPGPVFYRWQVAGERGRSFTGYKFRTMMVGADWLKHSLLLLNHMSGPVFKLPDDPRITRVGKFLRKYSIDELPQLWSVLKGDMSLVGPRPPLQSEYVRFTEWQKQKLLVRPGITCLWQINGRNRIKDFDSWVRMDLEYISKRSFRLDLKILLATIAVVIRGTGC